MRGRNLLLVPLVAIFLFLSAFSNESRATIAEFKGVYTGSYDGVDRGKWVVNVKANGICYLGSWSEIHRTVDYVIAEIYENGEIYYAWSNKNYVYFKVHSDGTVSAENGNYATGIVYVSGTGKKNDPAKIATYIGSYDGNFKGDDKGTLYFTVGDDGAFIGSVHSEVLAGSAIGVGTVTETGEIVGVSEDRTIVYGQISNKGKVSGEWHNYNYNANGTISAIREGSSSGGDGGGCFIDMVNN